MPLYVVVVRIKIMYATPEQESGPDTPLMLLQSVFGALWWQHSNR